MIYNLGKHEPSIDPTTYIAPGAYIIGQVELHKNTSVWFTSVLRGDNEPIKVGTGTNIQEGSILHVDPGYPLVIGENVTIGHRTVIHGCTIEEGKMIGMGAVVLNGAHIKKGAVVGENKIIAKETIAAGVLAKELKIGI
ncbi:carbonic anhydrase/acetyltransferase-like protein (isoleucine patch superfamily) [Geomicrobium halophilum]|uniref:Carbonic anhydrase/acetyltransferase-like protein (Isoleucine patch superfamily) n=1 Tax=Geomicrobium halophilum TaxID=549000 RepID=A0A841PIY1_9BACL|nr:gamma carbonic anhydrase family protein [Geomicrobium halophilum]MBB6448689.1 carbonic anhydrase/acetyltransferase-like protein (isoleucine patch superfamily) [Geomicrobium halophilum]